MAPKVYVFDAYGTLFDVHSAVKRHRPAVGPSADRLSEIWRVKQLEYAWTRSLMGRYRDFWALTEEALDVAAATAGVALSTEARSGLLEAYRTLDAYREVPGVLRALKEAGHATAILSNGPPSMLEPATEAAGISDALDAVLSVDAIGVYKTDPRAYELVGARFGSTPGEVSFQSSNRWDIAGASAFGFRAVWVNRSGAPDEYPDLPPARVIDGLGRLLE